jgi:hypothetical protein
MPKVHIGKKIKEVWRESRLKGTEFAALINRDRQVIYDIFKRESIDTDLLKQISKVLKHDFFRYYSSDLPVVADPGISYEYVTKDEFDSLKKLVEKIAKKIDERLGEKPGKNSYLKEKKSGKK